MMMCDDDDDDEYWWRVLSGEMCDVGENATTRDWTEVLVIGGYRMRVVLSLKEGIA